MTFWIVAAALALAVALLLGLAMVRARGAGEAMVRTDLRIYRDQLSGVEKDVARGTVSAEDADRLRTEIKRRILEADRADDVAMGKAPAGLTYAAVVLAALLLLGGSGALYFGLGAPGYPDLPREARLAMAAEMRGNRPPQAEIEARAPRMPPPEASPEFMELMSQLRNAVAERPDDLQGHALLARNEASLGNFGAAHQAQARFLEIKGADASAMDYSDYGDLLVLAAGGYISPEAEAAFAAALARDPRNGTARYYLGALDMQTGRPDLAFRRWEVQLREGPPDAPWIEPIRAQIERAAQLAGIDYGLPPLPTGPALPGPDAADIEAAGEMSPEDRMVMIEGMVAGLGERLATEGGPPEDWARLIRAYGVLGRRDAAAAIWTEAQQVFTDPVALIPVLQAARDAGVEQ